MIISDRQKKLLIRYEKILIEDPMPVSYAWPDSGVGRNSFFNFYNGSKALSRNSLNKIENYILYREKELGI